MGKKTKDVRLSSGVARLLDANLNRAREGLRVVEDAARFLWNDKTFYTRIRFLRHELTTLTQCYFEVFLSARQVQSDAGRLIKEGARPSVQSVVVANIHRAQEAVRVLEEYSKVFSPAGGPLFKKIRYELYNQEKRVLKK